MKQLKIFAISFILTLLVTRLLLHLFPFVHDLNNFGPYNIRHIFVGGLLMVIALLMLLAGRNTAFVAVIAGVGSAWVIDEIVYLIATAGDYAGYVGGVSVMGMVILALVVLFAAFILKTRLK